MADQDDDFPPTWLLIKPLRADTPARIRVRAALKALLRSYRIRVLKISGAGPDAEPATAGARPDTGRRRSEINKVTCHFRLVPPPYSPPGPPGRTYRGVAT
jgi:hypothetical protein